MDCELLFIIISTKRSLSFGLSCFLRSVLSRHNDPPSATEHCSELLNMEGHRMFVYRMKSVSFKCLKFNLF